MKIVSDRFSCALVAALRMLERSLDHSLTGSATECSAFFQSHGRLKELRRIFDALKGIAYEADPQATGILKHGSRLSPLALLSFAVGKCVLREQESESIGGVFHMGLELAEDLGSATRPEIIRWKSEIWHAEYLLRNRIRPSKLLERAVLVESYNSPMHVETIPLSLIVEFTLGRESD